MFDTKTILIILAILLLIFMVYNIQNKSENLNSTSESTSDSTTESKYSNFVQEFISFNKDNNNNFILNETLKFKITNGINSLDGINENILINDNDNDILLIGKIHDLSNNPVYSFIYSLNDIIISVDNSGNPELNLTATTPVINHINSNPIQFNNGVLTINVDKSANPINFPSDKTINNNSKLIAYSDNKGYGFGIKLENNNKKMIAYQQDISNNLKKYYPVNYKDIVNNTFATLIQKLQEYLKNHKK